MSKPCWLYRVVRVPERVGWTVYRHDTEKVSGVERARQCPTATFTCEMDADQYAALRNQLVDHFGSDKVDAGQLLPNFLTPCEARRRWGGRMHTPNAAVKTWDEFVELDGRWRPVFDGLMNWVGYQREDG